MPELEQEYASQVVLGYTTEILEEAKVTLEQQLAKTALRLVEVREQLEAEPAPITAKIRTAYSKYWDDGYIGGHVEENQKTFIINSSYFVTAYLGALARQVTAVGSGGEMGENSRYLTADYTSIALEEVAVGEGSELEHPIDKVRDVFNNSSAEAFLIVNSLREAVEANNPYRDIPIKINQYLLLDALLRVEILKYCQANDPHFHIQELKEGFLQVVESPLE